VRIPRTGGTGPSKLPGSGIEENDFQSIPLA